MSEINEHKSDGEMLYDFLKYKFIHKKTTKVKMVADLEQWLWTFKVNVSVNQPNEIVGYFLEWLNKNEYEIIEDVNVMELFKIFVESFFQNLINAGALPNKKFFDQLSKIK